MIKACFCFNNIIGDQKLVLRIETKCYSIWEEVILQWLQLQPQLKIPAGQYQVKGFVVFLPNLARLKLKYTKPHFYVITKYTCYQVLFGNQQSAQVSLLFLLQLFHSLIKQRSCEAEYKLFYKVLTEHWHLLVWTVVPIKDTNDVHS